MDDILKQLGVTPAAATFQAKRAVVDTALRALGATFELVSELSPEFKQETADWEEGRVLGMGVLPHGPEISLRWQEGRIRYLGTGLMDPTISILFKNMDAALMTFTAQIGAHMASIQHRVVVHGNIGHAMQVMRAMAIVQKFLLPTLLLNNTTKRPVQLSGAELAVKARVMAGLVPRLAMTILR